MGSGSDGGQGEQGGRGGARVSRRTALRLGLGAATAALLASVAEGATQLHLGGHGYRTSEDLADQPRSATTQPSSITRPSSTAARVPPSTTATPPPTTAPSTTPPTAPPSTAPPSTGAGQAPAPASAQGFFGPPDGNAVYLTIDDGWFPDDKVLGLMRSERVPLTTFLISQAANDDAQHFAFWKSFLDAGGQIQNHTVSHPWLTKLPAGQVEAQWEGASQAFGRWFGTRPTLGRAPYGAVDEAVWQAATNAGLSQLVMWSAVADGAGLQTWDGAPLAPGAIVLMHWDPGLYSQLKLVLAAVERRGLVPRPLPATAWT